MLKVRLYTIAFIGLLIGCGFPVNHSLIEPSPNVKTSISVGEILYAEESMHGDDNGMGNVFYGDNYRYDLTILSASKSKIKLEYNEYMKPVAGYGGYAKDEAWLIKSKFTKDFTYEIEAFPFIIVYKKLRFEVVKVQNGIVEYKRL
jgi:hypothetical protein